MWGLRLSVAVAGAVGASCSSPATGTKEDLPPFLGVGKPLHLGALMCVTGEFSAKASSLEQTLVLAEEYINGDPRAYDMPVDQIPCRVAGNCGVWVGTDSSGNAIRGPV